MTVFINFVSDCLLKCGFNTPRSTNNGVFFYVRRWICTIPKSSEQGGYSVKFCATVIKNFFTFLLFISFRLRKGQRTFAIPCFEYLESALFLETVVSDSPVTSKRTVVEPLNRHF